MDEFLSGFLAGEVLHVFSDVSIDVSYIFLRDQKLL
jgi:hypothetical protein